MSLFSLSFVLVVSLNESALTNVSDKHATWIYHWKYYASYRSLPVNIQLSYKTREKLLYCNPACHYINVFSMIESAAAHVSRRHATWIYYFSHSKILPISHLGQSHAFFCLGSFFDNCSFSI